MTVDTLGGFLNKTSSLAEWYWEVNYWWTDTHTPVQMDDGLNE